MEDNSFYYEKGSQGVLLIHGLTGTPTEMKFVGKGLAKEGFTVYGMQLAGHCGDESDLLATGWKDWYRSVEAAFDSLRKRCSTVFVGGLSMGAVLALHLGARRPGDVSGMALYSTTLKYDGWAIPRLRFLLPFVMHLPFGKRYRFVESPPYGIKDERLRHRVEENMFSGRSGKAGLPSTPAVSLRELWRLVAVVKRELSGVRTPALILHSGNDDIAGIGNAEYVERRLTGQVRKIILDDCYHMITVDKQRQEVVRHTADFFQLLGGELPEDGVLDASTAVVGGAALQLREN